MPVSPKISTLPSASIESPTQKVVREARPQKTVRDAEGRTIIYRPLSILDQARLYRAIGAEHSKNSSYMNLVNVAAAVVSIDNDTGPPLTTLLMIESRMSWLGDEGYVAILAEAQREADEMMDDAVEANISFRDDVKN